MSDMNYNAIGWFEIPTVDIQRAMQFYKNVLGYDFHYMDLGNIKMALFPSIEEGKGSSGALVQNTDFYVPSNTNGPLLYLTCPQMDDAIQQIESNGGQIIIPKRQISPEYGYMAVFLDSEGNRMALHMR